MTIHWPASIRASTPPRRPAGLGPCRPAGYDHSYLKPHVGRLRDRAQVVYVDLRGHARSEHGRPEGWSLERCADDLHAFCQQLGIVRPLLFGHSMGGFVALLQALRHPEGVGRLLLQATAARQDVPGLVERLRRSFGDELADIAERTFTGTGVVDPHERRKLLRCLGPTVPEPEVYQRIVANPDLAAAIPDIARFDVVDQLHRIEVPTLVTVGDLDPVTPVEAAQEIVTGLRDAPCHLEVMEGFGHFPWLDDPARYWPHVEGFIDRVQGGC